MISVYRPNNLYAGHMQQLAGFSIFLAGSIDNGKAEKWQDKVIKAFQTLPADLHINLLNPRRDNWNSSEETSIENEAFREQVEWELQGLEVADMVLFYFDPKTKSPISMFELGLVSQKRLVMVCCPDGFWKKGNVDVICERYSLMQQDSLEELIRMVKVCATIESQIKHKQIRV